MRWVALLLCIPASAAEWVTAAPAAVGLEAGRLEALQNRLARHATRAFAVVRDGRLVWEWYAEGVRAADRQGTASLAKALVGGTSLMLAMEDGRIRAEDAAAEYIPAWKDDPRKRRITIRQLATHTSGIEDAEQDGIPHMELPGWKGEFWRRRPNPFATALRDAPVLFEPGERFHYSNPGMAALAYAVAASYRGGDGRELLRERVMKPLGIVDGDWSISYGERFELDGLALYANWGGGAFTPRAAARMGQWMMEGEGWRRRMVQYAGMPVPDRREDAYAPGSGLCWWTNFDGVWKGLPRDAFAGAGAGHEILLVVPSWNLVVVRNGRQLSDKPYWTSAYEELLAPVAEAVGLPPVAASKAIRGVEFAPVDSIVRAAIDSDNWPMTWGDDDAIYTSYGDGWGFAPRTDRKLSLGFARVVGGPLEFRGENIRSASGEKVGDGARGLKASGLLMVDGILYLWARNAANAQLAWSADRGSTWEWGFRWRRSFASPSFLQFGKNYRGARDGHVYVYSQDGESAYEPSDRIVLARAPKRRIREERAWEFWTGNGWSREVEQRGGVLEYPGHCERVEVVYHAGLKRYLMALGYDHASGWGLYEAPEPWGPWSVAFHTRGWDVPGGHGYRIPVKWMDGSEFHLVFSGTNGPGVHYDAFSVRKGRLLLP